MNVFYFILIFMTILMFSDNIKKTFQGNTQIEVDDYKTLYFEKDSKDFFEEVKNTSGYSEETLKELAMMEDQFLEFENQTVCQRVSRLREAMTLDQQMKDRFQGWDFHHHQKHIKQMAEPNKLINKNLSCFI